MASRTRLIQVTGNGSAAADCDAAQIKGAVAASRPSVVEASQLVSATTKDVHENLLKMNGVTSRDITTTNISISTEYQYNPDGVRGPPTYKVSTSLVLRLRDATGDLVAEAVDAMVSAAGDRLELHDVSFTASDAKREGLEAAARRCAAEDALAKGKLYAEALGVAVGQVMEIRETHDTPYRPVPMMRMQAEGMSKGMGNFAAPVAMGEMSVTAQLHVTFEMKSVE